MTRDIDPATLGQSATPVGSEALMGWALRQRAGGGPRLDVAP